MGDDKVGNANMDVTWDETSRVAFVRYLPGSRLGAADGDFFVETLTRWAGRSGAKFAVIADAKELESTDGAYRARASTFFKEHRDRTFVTLTNVGPVIHLVVEMFRIGTGTQIKTFSTEAAARAWLQGKGINA